MTQSFRPTLLHRLWRLLPPRRRRRLFAEAAAFFAPPIDRITPKAKHGVAVLGELSQPVGLGEGARLMLRALDSLNVATWSIEIDSPLSAANRLGRIVPRQLPPAGAPLVNHINAPLLPLALLRLPPTLVRG